MLIECPNCHIRGEVPEEYAGKRMKCKCGASFVVSTNTQTPTPQPSLVIGNGTSSTKNIPRYIGGPKVLTKVTSAQKPSSAPVILSDGKKVADYNRACAWVKWIWIAVSLMVVLCIGSIIIGKVNSYQEYKQDIKKAEDSFRDENYADAKKFYQMALDQWKDNATQHKLDICSRFKASLDGFNNGTDLFNRRDYLGAYNSFRSVIPEDSKRFNLVKDKILESRRLYIDEQLEKARSSASNNDYPTASTCLNSVLAVDSSNENAKNLIAQFNSEKAAKAKALAKTRGVQIGMTKQEVLDSSWGKPKSINKTTTIYGTHEQWVYGMKSYLYFEDGILTSYQN